MLTTKEKPFAAAKQNEEQLNEAHTPRHKQDTIPTIKNKPIKTKANLISLRGNSPITTSLIVADKFQKRHDNVLQKIENIMEEDICTDLNFKVSKYKDSTGRFLKMYSMDKKSFIILFMRFTGKPALHKQIKFVDAFEKMERILLNRQNISWQQGRTGSAR